MNVTSGKDPAVEMTVMIFYNIGGQWDRHSFDTMDDEEILETLYATDTFPRTDTTVRFYMMDHGWQYHDFAFLEQRGFLNRDEFVDDYNNELLDCGWWCVGVRLPMPTIADIVRRANP